MLDDFVFGAATSAYQIEGAWNEDDKVPSIWDSISHGNTRFQVRNKHTGDIACDHYHRWKEDIKLMKKLGINAYRFSIAWSRICSKEGCFNLKGIRFYSELVDELLKNNIEPFVTLFHWDLPQWLDDIGGWGVTDSIEAFLRYADSMMNKLDKVKYWATFNEPAVFIPNFWGHNNYPEAVRNVLLAHGHTVQLNQEKYNKKIGIVLNLMPFSPLNEENIGDRLAAENVDKMHNRIWLDPLFYGRFPGETRGSRGEISPDINTLFGLEQNTLDFNRDESETVKSPMDFLGINYYTAGTVKYNSKNPPSYAETVSRGNPKDDMGVEWKPFGIYELLRTLNKNYGEIEMYITENGCAYTDTLTHDQQVHDLRRIEYIRQHLKVCQWAVEKGYGNLRGYFYWSLLDNFEWLYGYTKRFGLTHVDYPTQKRFPKDSFYWYQKIIKNPVFRKQQLEVKGK